MFRSRGVLTYNADNNEFKITAPERVKTNTYEGNQFILDDAHGKVKLEGKVDFFNSVQNEYILSAGTAEIDLASNSYSFNTLLGFNFPIAQQVAGAMSDKIIDATAGNSTRFKEANPDKEALFVKIAQIAGENAAKNYKQKSGADHTPLIQASKRFLTTLVLSNVNLKWSEENKAFYSVGKLGVSNIANADINAEMDGMVEIRKHASGDQVTIYLEVAPDQWYFFNFQQNKLSLASSNPA